ncbi:unnamed protein product [Parnassius apollo]|uniref:(apollo) hypothetical protein n=1 Tax=Parnassius apollo TaxID=110799 RepID=A0A8S3XKP6_PARAO|nr:unnamed protein product [Parnassius apollo]
MARCGGGSGTRAAAVRVRLSPSYLSRPPPDAHVRRAPPCPRPRRIRAMSPYRRFIYVIVNLYDYSSKSVGRSPKMSQ